MRAYDPSMPDGRPQHHLSGADGLMGLESNTVSIPGALKENT
jgi:hypothetical protein